MRRRCGGDGGRCERGPHLRQLIRGVVPVRVGLLVDGAARVVTLEQLALVDLLLERARRLSECEARTREDWSGSGGGLLVAGSHPTDWHTRRRYVTTRSAVVPGRHTRPSTCSSTAGFQLGSKRTRRDAPTRLRPVPPACGEERGGGCAGELAGEVAGAHLGGEEEDPREGGAAPSRRRRVETLDEVDAVLGGRLQAETL